MTIFLDTANINDIRDLSAILPIAGVTTNPTIAAKSATPMHRLLPQLRKALGHDGPLFAQVIAIDAKGMVEEAIRLNSYINHLVVKIPVNAAGLSAIQTLKNKGIRTLGTAVYTANQGLLAALAGAEFIAPYINRIDMLSNNGIETVRTLVQLLNLHAPHCQVLGASFKNIHQVVNCLACGNTQVTIPTDIAKKMFQNPAVDEAINQFRCDWYDAFGNYTI